MQEQGSSGQAREATSSTAAPAVDPWNITTLEQAKQFAAQAVKFSVEHKNPCAFEVVRTKNGKGEFVVQPFGIHTLFKTHKLLHVEPVAA